MTPSDEAALDALLRTPLLAPPDDFVPRVVSALPAQIAVTAPRGPTWAPRLGWLQAALALLCGALGALEVLLFVSGLWLGSTAAFGQSLSF